MRSLMRMASSKLPPSQLMKATRMFWPSASSPFSVEELSAIGCALVTRGRPCCTIGRWLMQVPWFERTNLRSVMRMLHALVVDDDDLRARSRSTTSPSASATTHLAGVEGGLPLDARADDRRLRAQQRHRLALHVRAHQRAVRVVVLQERNQRGGDAHRLLRRDVHVVDAVELAPARSCPGSAPARASSTKWPSSSSGALACAIDERLFLVGGQVVHLVGDERLDAIYLSAPSASRVSRPAPRPPRVPALATSALPVFAIDVSRSSVCARSAADRSRGSSW